MSACQHPIWVRLILNAVSEDPERLSGLSVIRPDVTGCATISIVELNPEDHRQISHISTSEKKQPKLRAQPDQRNDGHIIFELLQFNYG